MTPMCAGSCSTVVGEPLTVSSRRAASGEVRGDSPPDACCCPFLPASRQPIATTGSTTTQIGGSALGRAPAGNSVAPAISTKANVARRGTPLMPDVVGRRPRQGREVSLRRGAAAGDLYGNTLLGAAPAENFRRPCQTSGPSSTCGPASPTTCAAAAGYARRLLRASCLFLRTDG